MNGIEEKEVFRQVLFHSISTKNFSQVKVAVYIPL